jgi:hypothetical protein
MLSTQELMKETWPEVADDYIKDHCTNIVVNNPFTKERVELGTSGQKSTPVVKSESEYKPDPLDYGDWLNE